MSMPGVHGYRRAVRRIAAGELWNIVPPANEIHEWEALRE
jgi:hypothetical protein